MLAFLIEVFTSPLSLKVVAMNQLSLDCGLLPEIAASMKMGGVYKCRKVNFLEYPGQVTLISVSYLFCIIKYSGVPLPGLHSNNA